MQRRSLLAAALAAPAVARAAEWPNGAIRIISCYTPGGANDLLGRFAADVLGRALGVPCVVENRPGAGGNLGMESVARAAPDGQTLVVAAGAAAINQTLYKNLSFDLRRDFAPVTLLGAVPNVLGVHPGLPVRSTAEFIAWAKARPQGVTFGSPGIGTTPHLAGALFAQRAGYNGIHVPFRGAAQGVPAVLSGSVDFSLDNLASWIPVLGEGRARGLAVTSAERWPTLPDVPTMAEAGMPDFVVTSWAAIIAPIATPKPVVERISQAFRAASEMPQVRARMLQSGGLSVWTSPEATMARARAERPMWQEMVRVSGAKAD
jgi:tripartite-type tricarboxylate transporter receptor subunit TctC